jgi:hypothetical protein
MPSSNIALLTPDGPNGKLERRWFTDPTGQMTVRVWDTTACHCKLSAAQTH